jgi:hypothetical protein
VSYAATIREKRTNDEVRKKMEKQNRTVGAKGTRERYKMKG